MAAQQFKNPSRIVANEDPQSVWVADFNGDGRLDILYGDPSNTPGLIHILLGQPDGGYREVQPLVLPKGVGVLCRTLDANQDGKTDIACLKIIDTFTIEIATFLGNGDGTFKEPIYSGEMQSYNGYFNPLMSPAADLNRDSYPDLIVHDLYDDFSYILLGDGKGGFRVASTVPDVVTVDGFTFDYVAMDLDGDGIPDLVSSNGPVVWHGNGNGTFKDDVTYGIYEDCVYHDMDGDGRPDAVCATVGTNAQGDTSGSMSLVILHGKGDGSFDRTPIVTKTYGNPLGGYGEFIGPIAVMDINGDGIPDILAYAGDGLAVVLGQKNLNFASPIHYSVGFLAMTGEDSTQFADLNNDGKIDLVCTGPNGIYIANGNGRGGFFAPRALSVGQTVNTITLADFNGDSIPDLVANGDKNLKLSLGNGDGTFKPPISLPRGDIDFSIAANGFAAPVLHGDFRGIGRHDILAVGSPSIYTSQTYLLENEGKGKFSSPILVPSIETEYETTWPAAVIDINKDGRDDVLIMKFGAIDFALSNGKGTFHNVSTRIPTQTGNFGDYQTLPAFADFDHDGKIDVVYGAISDLFVLKGHGDGTFESSGRALAIPNFEGQAPQYPIAVATGDFDGDGHPDIAVLVQYGPAVIPLPTLVSTVAFVYYGKGNGAFGRPVVAGAFNHDYTEILAADVNHDGRSDLIVNSTGIEGGPQAPVGDSIGVVLSLPGRNFAEETDYDAGRELSAVTIKDLNHDGYPDLLAANETPGFGPVNSITVLMNRGKVEAVSGNLTVSPEPASPVQSITIQAMLYPPNDVSLPGSITFWVNGDPYGTVPLEHNSATITFPDGLPAGLHEIDAIWPGDSKYPSLKLTADHTVRAKP